MHRTKIYRDRGPSYFTPQDGEKDFVMPPFRSDCIEEVEIQVIIYKIY